jgi:hypothetical protein
LELRVNGLRALRLEPTANDFQHSNIVNVLNGSPANFITPGVYGATIAGGGAANFPPGFGGFSNKVVLGDFGTIGGGINNTISNGTYATVCGGQHNAALGGTATVCGGVDNVASGLDSTVPGGYNNTAAGDFSFAAGSRARANHHDSFVWSDSSAGPDLSTTAPYQFLIRAIGGVGIGLNNPASQLHVASASGNPQLQITQATTSDYARLRMNVLGSQFWEMDVSPGATPAISWWNTTLRMNLDFNGNLTTSGTVNGTSDRNAKEKFTAVSSRAVLDKVAALPISEWNFKNEPETRHIGPMAQDFYVAFSVGMDDKHIATVDEGGVALAAIQGLNQKLTEELKRRDAKNAELNQRLAALEKIIHHQESK